MTIDLFGHGIEDPLPPGGGFSHGSDRLTGPHRCRGGTKPCAGNTSDHMCCCDACRHRDYFACTQGCCKCLPISMCVTFTPTTPDGACKVRTWRVVPSQPTGTVQRITYGVSIGGQTLTISAGSPEYGSPLFGSADCTWRFEYGYIDEEYEITHLDGGVNCLSLPDVEFDATIIVEEEPCVGTITISEFTYQKVPYKSRWHGQDIETPLYETCGDCTEVCSVIAAKRGTADDYGDADAVCIEFIWDAAYSQWVSEDGEVISLTTSGYSCAIELTTWEQDTFEGDVILLELCAIGMVVTARDELGNWLQISCNPCSCWEHICGTCRCICRTLCVIGIDNGVLTGPWELNWNSETFQWESEEEGAPAVSVNKRGDGGCEIVLSGTDLDTDPLEISPTCGNSIGFTFANSIADQLVNGPKVLAGWCKACEGSCDSGTCLSFCDTVPKVLYAIVSPTDWTPMLGCEGFPATDCFEEFTIPLVQIFVTSDENPAGEWRWIGSTTFSCRGCDTGGNPSHKEYRNTLAVMDIGCDGVGTLSITGFTSDLVTTATVVVDLEFILPCGAYADWEAIGPWSGTNAGGMLCCNNGAGFSVALTETSP